MTEFPSLELSSWANFSSRVSELAAGPPTNPTFLFRGQADSGWALSPKLTRLLQDKGITDEKIARRVESRITAYFEARAHHYVTTGQQMTIMVPNRFARWSIMQHYGAPTRLLDWTESAYVAAYFACSASSNRDGVVFVASAGHVCIANKVALSETPVLADQLFDSYDPAITKIGFMNSSVLSEREIVQMGHFSFSPLLLSKHDDGLCLALRPGSPADGRQLMAARWIIPQSLKVEFLRNLRQMNIGAHSLFPGLGGLGRSLEELAILEASV